ncbi:MAG: hypothetical protein WA399_12820 [Acidobacteriaceae bacterium]|jgi:hypothetical protein
MSNDLSVRSVADLSVPESRLLHEFFEGMQDIRYRSTSLTIHDGRRVEVHPAVTSGSRLTNLYSLRDARRPGVHGCCC